MKKLRAGSRGRQPCDLGVESPSGVLIQDTHLTRRPAPGRSAPRDCVTPYGHDESTYPLVRAGRLQPKLRILVIEDDDKIRRAIRTVLAREGYEVRRGGGRPDRRSGPNPGG
jgi:hypothetical protein